MLPIKKITYVIGLIRFRHCRKSKHRRAHLSHSSSYSQPGRIKKNINPLSPTYRRIQLFGVFCTAVTVVGIIFSGIVLRNWSSIVHTSLITGTASPVKPLFEMPKNWKLAWQSPTTSPPLATSSVIITTDEHSVIAHNPTNGQIIWQYTRNVQLCNVVTSQDSVIALYRDSRGCGDATKLDSITGKRITARSEFSDPDSRLDVYGDEFLFFGPKFVQLWTYDLVTTVEYGTITAPAQPNSQHRQGCRLLSGFTGNSSISIIEQCPQEEFARLTVIENKTEKDHDPIEIQSRALPILGDGTQAHILYSSKDKTLLAILQTSTSSLDFFEVSNTHDGTKKTLLAQIPVHGIIRIAHNYDTTSVWCSGKTILINGETSHIISTIDHTIGPGVFLTHNWFIPTLKGLVAINSKGRTNYILNRRDHNSPILLATDGRDLIEESDGIIYVFNPTLDHHKVYSHF